MNNTNSRHGQLAIRLLVSSLSQGLDDIGNETQGADVVGKRRVHLDGAHNTTGHDRNNLVLDLVGLGGVNEGLLLLLLLLGDGLAVQTGELLLRLLNPQLE